jgi:hypothetical protein
MSQIYSRHWKISIGRHFQNGYHNSAQIQHCNDNRLKKLIKSYLWNRTMLNMCGIVVATLKMETDRNFSMSGINLGHHYVPTYQILMISDNVEFLRPFWKWQPLEIFQWRFDHFFIFIYSSWKVPQNRDIFHHVQLSTINWGIQSHSISQFIVCSVSFLAHVVR